MQPRRTRRDDNPVETVLGDGLLDLLLARVRARVEIGRRERHTLQGGGVLGNRRAVDRGRDIHPAMTYENTYSRFQTLSPPLIYERKNVSGLYPGLNLAHNHLGTCKMDSALVA